MLKLKQVITTIRDSTQATDGVLYHESALYIEEHYTDTNGFTDHAFAIFPTIRSRFAPRICDLKELKLYVPDKRPLFLVDRPLDPALRQRVTTGLNEGESRKTPARAACFNRLVVPVHIGSMLKSALNLVVTAGNTPFQICATTSLPGVMS